MNDQQNHPLTRNEKELLRYFRELPAQYQLDMLGTAEASYNAMERMKILGDRQFERRPEEKLSDWH